MADEPLQKLTEEEFANWVPVVRVMERLTKHLTSHSAAVEALVPRLTSGLIRAGAANHAFQDKGESPRGMVEIRSEQWAEADQLEHNYNFWRSGTLLVGYDTGELGYRGTGYLTYFGVRFEPVGVEGLIADIAPDEKPLAPVVDARPPHPGGAPRKPFWDDLWAAIGALIYKGVIHPGSKSKDIEDAMVQWAVDHDEDLSVPSARPRARKLLEALKSAEKNNN